LISPTYTINNGGKKLGGWMPEVEDKLSEQEKQALLDYLHSLWPKNIQKKYDMRFK
jgi:mono/diheme cytochrome c family protein